MTTSRSTTAAALPFVLIATVLSQLAGSGPASSGAAADRPVTSQVASATDAPGPSAGLHALVDTYRSRARTGYTRQSWTPFAGALSRAEAVLAQPDATPTAVVAAKNALQDAAGALAPLAAGSFQPIVNDAFRRDTAGNPIYSQGGGIFRFGDTYYWYGVRYAAADDYVADPSRTYPSDFQSITVYSSRDLANWTFENDVATLRTPLRIPASKGTYFAQMRTLADATWVGRLGVVYNENTGRYVLLVQMSQGFDPDERQNSSVLFLQADSPTAAFTYANIQPQIVNSPSNATGDQTVFTDDNGSDYLIFSNRFGRQRAFVSRIAPADSLSVEPAVQVGLASSGREGNAMFRLRDTYYMATSDLHGWNSSVNHVIQSRTAAVQGQYTAEYTLPGTEKDYSHVSQTGFFVTVKGTAQTTVLYAGDRWADFAWNGLGYHQWVPLSETTQGLTFNSLRHWELNAVTGEWRVGSGNNYVLNPDFAADRIAVTTLTGWTTTIDTSYSTNTFVSNVTPGADRTRWALQLGNANAFSGAVSQQNRIPDGRYRFTAKVDTAGGLTYARVVVSDGANRSYRLDINRATNGWATVTLPNLTLTGGTATVRVEARSAGGNRSVRLDGLALTAEVA